MFSHLLRHLGWFAGLAVIFALAKPSPTRAQTSPVLSGPDLEASTVPVVSLDELGRSQVKMLPTARYRSAMSSASSAVHDSVVAVLDEHSERQAKAGQRWTLQTIGVGLGLTGQIGLGPLVSITASPRVRFIFSNSKSPVYPD